jgi:osmotically-inducible protein OsmY
MNDGTSSSPPRDETREAGVLRNADCAHVARASGHACASVTNPAYGGPRQLGEFEGRGPRGLDRSDSTIRADVIDRLEREPELDARAIIVHVEHGEIELAGSVRDLRSRRVAEAIAFSVVGREGRVHDGIQIARGAFVAP